MIRYLWHFIIICACIGTLAEVHVSPLEIDRVDKPYWWHVLTFDSRKNTLMNGYRFENIEISNRFEFKYIVYHTRFNPAKYMSNIKHALGDP